jgi:predicted component of type VI protein secretion system
MVSLEFDFDVQLKLKAAEVPGTVLTTRAVRKPMLGWTSFLKSQPFKTDDEQLVLAL